jgi:hypothetical protein
MARRKDLSGAAFGVLGTFVSRNNDVGGYWALGKLYAHARANDVHDVHVDLLTQSITPPSGQFDEMIAFLRERLARQLAARGVPLDWLKGAEIALSFGGEKSANRAGDTFEVVVALTDDREQRREARNRGACWPHDPIRESRSARA